MESRRSSKFKSDLDEEDVVAEEVLPTYTKVSTKKLQSRISAKIKLSGSVTGKLYIWEGSGAIVEVDERDVEELLTKKLGDNACCGGNIYNNMLFGIVE